MAYSILTYYCAYFRYHYPLEFITALLNSADTDEKIKSGTSLAALKGIRIMPIRFRHSLSEYTIDREDKAIYKGMSSIKYLNKSMGRELYKLRDKTYDSFIDLLDDISKKKICDSRQLDILIKLDFFNEFGNPNQLLKQVEYFNQFNGAKQLSKEETDAIVPHDIMQCMCVKETAKKYVDVDHAAIIRYLAQTTADITTPISCRLQYEVDHLGYIQLTIPTLADNYYCVLSVDGKYSNKMLTLYRLRDGVSVQMKVKKYSIERDPIVEKDIIKAEQISDEPKWGRTPDGEWYQKTETERVLKKYIHVRPKGG